MKHKEFLLIGLFVVLVLLMALVPGGAPSTAAQLQRASPAMPTPVPDRTQVAQASRSSPVMFVENVGQFPNGARFQVWGGPGTMWLAEDAIWITVVERSKVDTLDRFDVQRADAERADEAPRGVNLKLSFPGANPHPRIEPFDHLDTVVSYFIGNDPAKWRSAVPVWGGVRYRNLYPGVDLEITSQHGRWTWRLACRANWQFALQDVRLQVGGADALALYGHRLRLTTAAEDFTLPLPVTDFAFQVNGITTDGRETTFNVQHTMPTEAAVVHQDNPADLLYSTFLGGSSNEGENGDFSIAVDTSGAAYVSSTTNSSNFPTTLEAFDTTLGGNRDVFVTKLNSAGNGLVYSTFIGGSNFDEGFGIAVDAYGSAYVTGYTKSSNLPTTSGAFDTTCGTDGRCNIDAEPRNADAFVTKLNPTGSGLVYSTYLGGSGFEFGMDIAVDASGAAYITGKTGSYNFPTTAGAFDTTLGEGIDAFVTKLNAAGSRLIYSTFLGGSDQEDQGHSIAVDASGAAYVTGLTWSPNFPTTPGAFDTTYEGTLYGPPDAFVTKLNATGSGLVYSTFLGGNGSEDGPGIAVDASGAAYITGCTESSNFPTTPGAFTAVLSGYSGAFVTKLNATGNGLVYSTFLGGSDGESGYGIAVDANGAAYISGSTGSSNFPTTPGAFTTTLSGRSDAFVTKLNASGSELVYSTYLGGSASDAGTSISLDGSGVAYVMGSTSSANFPTTAGAFDTSYNGWDDAFVAKLAVRGGPWSFNGTISPIYPADHVMRSPVMQGGTAYRHFRLLDAGGSPIPNATVTFSAGGPAPTDASGHFTFTVAADALGGSGGTYPVSVQSAKYGGQTYTTDGHPTFNVEVTERDYSHAWSYGASTRAKGGASGGLIAYLYRTTSGGLELKLEESNPDATSDDVVLMKEDFSDEIGAGGGVGIEKEVSIWIAQIKGDASATSEFALRSIGSSQARFPNPYSDNDRKAEGVFLLASVIDSIGQAFPGKPFAFNFLKLALDRGAPYRGYISQQQAGLGSKITPLQVGVGASASLGLKRGGATWKERLLGFDLVDVGVTMVQMNTLTDYRDRNEWGLGFESEHDVDWSWLSWQIGDFRNKFAGTIGDRAKKVKVELVFDASTNALKRLELSFTGEGNPYAFTDVLKEEVTLKLIIPTDQLGSDRLSRTVNIIRLLNAAQRVGSAPLQIGPSAMVNELNNLLNGLGYTEYEVTVDDGAETHYEAELGVTAVIKIELGPALKVKKVRSLVRERGVFLNGRPYKTESYAADSYVSRPGKSWWDLTKNALGGLWLLVRDAFNWVWQQVTSGLGWVIGTASRTLDGVVRGGARITAPPGTQLYATGIGPQATAIQETDPITVTAMGWVPESAVGAASPALHPAAETASGAGFVVGGIYAFQPYTLTMSPAATLVITYTDEAAAGVDENRIRLFRWNPEGNNWLPTTAHANLMDNTFTANITQLGTFALGYDGTAPRVSILAPADGSIIANALPLISALVVDTGVGIDPATVQMWLDGQVVAAEYVAGTGQLMYLPGTPLADGPHTVTVSAADVVGTLASATSSFQVRIHRIYLPLVLRNR